MVELTDQEQKIVEAMKMLRAIDEGHLKTVDHIAKAARLPKGIVANLMQALQGKGVVKRVAREKAAGYYLLQA